MKFISGFYFLTVLLFSIFSYLFIDPNFVYLHPLYSGFHLRERALATTIYVFFLFILVAFYVCFLILASKRKIGRKDFLILIVGSALCFTFSYPAILSFDIFNYIATAKTLFFYHENPYVTQPIEFISDPILQFTRAANKTALYGPIWLVLSGLPYVLGFGNYLATILSFKLLVGFFYFGLVSLLWKLKKNLFDVAFFALNPLVLIETFVSGHNDVVMMFFALFSFYILKKRNNIFLATLFLLASFFIKFASLFLLPVFLFVVIKTLQNKSIEWDRVFFLAAFSIFLIFLLSPLREEMYPWYFIWVLPFLSLTKDKHSVKIVSVAFTFGLLMRYIPYMFSGTYSYPTPIVRNIFMILPVVVVSLFLLFRQKKWQNIFHF